MKSHISSAVPSLLQSAKQSELVRDRQGAIERYKLVLGVKPKDKIALGRIRVLTEQSGIRFLVNFTAREPDSETLASMTNLFVKKPKKEALEFMREMFSQHPHSLSVLSMLAVAYYSDSSVEEALHCYMLASERLPENADFHRSIGQICKEIGFLEKAADSWGVALWLKPDEKLKDELQELEQRLGEIPSQLRLKANDLRSSDSIKRFKDTIKGREKRLTEALRAGDESTSLDISLDLSLRFHESAEALNNRGVVLKNSFVFDEAVRCFKKAASLDLNYAAPFMNLGALYVQTEDYPKALACFDRAIPIEPHSANAWYSRAQVQSEMNQSLAAIKSYEKCSVCATNEVREWALSSLIYERARICQWPIGQGEVRVEDLGLQTTVDKPYPFLSLEDNPGRQMRRAVDYCQQNFKVLEKYPAKDTSKDRSKKIKLAYFSADFRSFPGMYLMIGMLEKHDKDRFEIFAFSYGPAVRDSMRIRIEKAVDHFIDVSEKSDSDIVKLARDLAIDIAIHRNGYTKLHRTNIFALRVAPIQINYLGYPGTLGAPFIDYIVGDEILIPAENRNFITENVIYLPDTYQPNDNTREISKKKSTRSDYGLPEEAFVLACFNQTQKITQECFDIWLEILKTCDDTVLWLIKSRDLAEKNLRSYAAGKGIDPGRLYFANRIAVEDHLARHRHIDLCIDTFNYNAHTTTSDALWTGTPVVTKQGQQFSARVAASLLHAIELPELITYSDDEYKQLILELINDPEFLTKIKKKLVSNKLTTALFDTELYTRNFESAMQKAYELYASSSDSQDIYG